MLTVTVTFIAILALIQIPLTFFVGFQRLQRKIYLQDGGDEDMIKRIRGHANFTETVPITLLAMAGAEYAGVSPTLLWAGGTGLVIGRLAHYYTIRTSVTGNLRALGMILTFLAMAGFSIAILVKIYL